MVKADMPLHGSILPECTLSAFRFGAFPSEIRRPFLREAARACARYVRGGGSLEAIRPETSCVKGGRMILHPLPPDSGSVPDRTAVENGLRALEAQWAPLGLSSTDRLRFFLGFCEVLAKEDAVWLAWSRLWLEERGREDARRARLTYRSELDFPGPPPSKNGIHGVWLGNAETDAAGLLQAIRHLTDEEKTLLKKGPRATVWAASLLGEDVIIKYFEPNPRGWRRKLGPSRIRQAWAGTRLMQSESLNVPDVLGFIECIENGVPKDGYVIHRRIPDTEPFGIWLLKTMPFLNKTARVHLRHHLREEFLKLYRRGIYHKDTKTHNLLIRQLDNGALRFWWIDLEDIRAAKRVATWHVIRNLYQLNGSVPNRVSRRARTAFARGLHSRFPLVNHPLVHRHIEAKTRRRLLREIDPFKRP